MDLLDLYDVLEIENDVIFTQPGVVPKEKKKKNKFIPWEPYKAASSADRNDEKCPESLPNLISYAHATTSMAHKELNNNSTKERILKDGMKLKRAKEGENQELKRELEKLKEELDTQRKMNSELKQLMVATLSNELQGQVSALTEEKVKLANRVDKCLGKIALDGAEVEQCRIERDVWKCKFLAQSIRCDELVLKSEKILQLLLRVQDNVRHSSFTEQELRQFCELDLTSFFNKSPCEERLRPKLPNFTNLTIACCKNCSGKEIQLL